MPVLLLLILVMYKNVWLEREMERESKYSNIELWEHIIFTPVNVFHIII